MILDKYIHVRVIYDAYVQWLDTHNHFGEDGWFIVLMYILEEIRKLHRRRGL